MSYILANKIRENRLDKGRKAWKKAGCPTDLQALADKVESLRVHGIDRFGNDFFDWGDSDPYCVTLRKRYFFWKNVWIGALDAAGKNTHFLT